MITSVGHAVSQDSDRILDRKVTVCAECLMASCWLSIFICEKYRSAGTTELTVRRLHSLAYENPQYWFKDPVTGAIDQHGLAEYQALNEAEARG